MTPSNLHGRLNQHPNRVKGASVKQGRRLSQADWLELDLQYPRSQQQPEITHPPRPIGSGSEARSYRKQPESNLSFDPYAAVSGTFETEECSGPWRWSTETGLDLSASGDLRFHESGAKFVSGEGLDEYVARRVVYEGMPWFTYFGMWQQWCRENPNLVFELNNLGQREGKVLMSDAPLGQINNARSLAIILNMLGKGAWKLDPFDGKSLQNPLPT